MRELIIVSLLLGASVSFGTASAAPPSSPPSWTYQESLIIEGLATSMQTIHYDGTPGSLLGSPMALNYKRGLGPDATAAYAFEQLRQVGDQKDPTVLVSMQLKGNARHSGATSSAASAAGDRDVLLSLLPQGLASLFGPVSAGGGVSSSASLANFEWSMCGGRYKTHWPHATPSPVYAQDAAKGDAINRTIASIIHGVIYKHQNHVTCSMSPISSCYSQANTVNEEGSVRAHHGKLLRHWGNLIATTHGIGGSVYDIHDRYAHAPDTNDSPSRLVDEITDAIAPVLGASEPSTLRPFIAPIVSAYTATTNFFASPYYKYATDFDSGSGSAPSDQASSVDAKATILDQWLNKLSNFDTSALTGGTTSGNRLISAHKRPLGVESVPPVARKGGKGRDVVSSPPQCFHDVSTMERLCTENLLPFLYVWEELVQLGSVGITPSSSASSNRKDKKLRRPLPIIKRRLRSDEWSDVLEGSVPSSASPVSSLTPSARRREVGAYRSTPSPPSSAILPSHTLAHNPSRAHRRLSVVDAVLPNAIFILSTAYHAITVKVAEEKDAVGGESLLTAELDLTFILSTPKEVEAFQEFIDRHRSQEMKVLAQQSRQSDAANSTASIALYGNAIRRVMSTDVPLPSSNTPNSEDDVVGEAEGAEEARAVATAGTIANDGAQPAAVEKIAVALTALSVADADDAIAKANRHQYAMLTSSGGGGKAPTCTVSSFTRQDGEVKGELQLDVKCDFGASHTATAVVESLLLLPAHTVNPKLSGMSLYASKSAAGATAEVVRMWYDPLSTVTCVLLRQTLSFDYGAFLMEEKEKRAAGQPLEGGSALLGVTKITIPFAFPSLRLDQYPPDMNKAYLIPQVVSRVRFEDEGLLGAVFTGGEGRAAAGGEVSSQILHEVAMASLMDSAASWQEGAEQHQRVAKNLSSPWRYQRCDAPSSVTLPLPDPGMVFNVLSLSSALLALLIGRGIGIVLRRSSS